MPNLCIYAWLSRAGWLRHEQTQPAQYGVTAPKANSATQLQTVLSGCPASQSTSRRLLAPEKRRSEFRLSEPDSFPLRTWNQMPAERRYVSQAKVACKNHQGKTLRLSYRPYSPAVRLARAHAQGRQKHGKTAKGKGSKASRHKLSKLKTNKCIAIQQET